MININSFFKMAAERTASDLHITVNSPPILRIDGKLHVTDGPKLSPDQTKQTIYSILNDEQKASLEEKKELEAIKKGIYLKQDVEERKKVQDELREKYTSNNTS